MQHLDRILDRHDVHRFRLVDVGDHGGERRRLARAGRSGHEDQPSVLIGELADSVRQPHLFERGASEPKLPQDHRDGTALPEHVRAEASDVRDRVGEVHVSPIDERGLAVPRHDAVGDRLGLDRAERVALEADESVRQPDHRR
jgi:hypothetical protein